MQAVVHDNYMPPWKLVNTNDERPRITKSCTEKLCYRSGTPHQTWQINGRTKGIPSSPAGRIREPLTMRFPTQIQAGPTPSPVIANNTGGNFAQSQITWSGEVTAELNFPQHTMLDRYPLPRWLITGRVRYDMQANVGADNAFYATESEIVDQPLPINDMLNPFGLNIAGGLLGWSTTEAESIDTKGWPELAGSAMDWTLTI